MGHFEGKQWDLSQLHFQKGYREGKKNPKLFCSHFMSFYPIDFIFGGCIGEDQEFFWVPRNFGF